MRNDPFFGFWLFRQIQEDMEEEDRAWAGLLDEEENQDEELEEDETEEEDEEEDDDF